MADSKDQKPPTSGAGGGGDVVAPQEEDALFRLQMAVSDFVLGYWKYGAYAILAVLLAAAAYGGYTSWKESSLRSDYAAIARVDHRMPKVDEMARYGLAPMDDPADTQRAKDLVEGGKRFLAVGDEARGTPAVYAYLKAADAFRRANAKDERLAALEKAWAVDAEDLPTWAAGSGLAAALIDAGQTDRALGIYRELVGRLDGYLAEQALLALAGAQADAKKPAEAKATLEEFRGRFPESTRMAEAAAIDARLGSGG